MNKKMIVYILGKMLGTEGILLLIPAVVSLLYKEKTGVYFLVVAAVLFALYLGLGRKKPENKQIYGKEGFVIVGLAWILWSLFGALPFFLSDCIPNYIDAVFETVSGFTTTGSTILQNIEALPKGMNFWRCFTHWIGGMGVLVFVMMITSLDTDNSMSLMRAEVPGPEMDKLVPKVRHTAKLLYQMYFVLTIAEVIFLMFGGMNLYDAVVHSFSTAGTGGFSNRNASVAFYDSAYIDGVITVFMILFGINFNLYFLLLLKDWKSVLKNEELRVYLGVVAAAIVTITINILITVFMILFGINFNLYFLLLLKDWKSVLKNEELRVYLGVVAAAIVTITINILSMYETVAHAFRYASFQVGAIITTTGFYTADFEQWPELSKTILMMLMVIGACGGSTGGGIKVSRFMILCKSIRQEIHKMLHPNAVTMVRMNGKKVGADTMRSINIYFSAYVFIIIVSVLLVSLDNFDFATSFSGVLTTINNVGPGISQVGPTDNFHAFSALSKIVFSFDMLFGRLEIFPYLLILSPDLWRKRF